MLSKLRLDSKTLRSGYYAIFKSCLCYAFLVWAKNTNSVKRLHLLQKIPLAIMFFQNQNFQAGRLFRNYEILKSFDKAALENCIFISKSLTGFRSSHERCSLRKDVLRYFAKFTGKHLCQSLFLNKVAGLPATLLKKRLWHRL